MSTQSGQSASSFRVARRCTGRRTRCLGLLVLLAAAIPSAGASAHPRGDTHKLLRHDAQPPSAATASPWTLDLSLSLTPSAGLSRDLPQGELDRPLAPCYGLSAHLSRRLARLLDVGVRLEVIRWAPQVGGGDDLGLQASKRLTGTLVDLTLGPRLRLPLGQRAELFLALPTLGLSFEDVTGEGRGSGSGIAMGMEAGAIVHLTQRLGLIFEGGSTQRVYVHERGDGEAAGLSLDGTYVRAGVSLGL